MKYINNKIKNILTSGSIIMAIFSTSTAFAIDTQNRNIQVTGHIQSYIALVVHDIDFTVTRDEQRAGIAVANKIPTHGNDAIQVQSNTGYALTFYAPNGNEHGAANNLRLNHQVVAAENFDIDMRLNDEHGAGLGAITGAGFHAGAPGLEAAHVAIPADVAGRQRLAAGTTYGIDVSYNTAAHVFIPGDYVGVITVVATTLE